MSSSLGQKIRQLRKQRHLTQQELAEGVVTPSMISQIESNRATPSPKLLEQLAIRLDVEVAFFMEDMNHKSDQAHTYRRARALVEAGKHEEAIPLLHSLVSPPAPQFREDALYTELAECYIQLGQFSEAGDMYERVVQISLERSDAATAIHALYHLGRVHRRRDNPHMARMYWHRASELLRRHPELEMPVALKVQSNLGRVCLELKRYDTAVRSYQNALARVAALDAKLEEAVIHHGLATAYQETGDANRAIEATQAALELYEAVNHQRGINQCRVNLVVGLRLQQRYREAIDHIEQLLARPEIQQDHVRYGSLLAERAFNHLELGHDEDAAQDATAALEYDLSTDDKSRLHETKATCSFNRGNVVEALVDIGTASDFATQAMNDARVLHLRNVRRQCLVRLGLKDDAVACALEVAAECVAYALPGK